MNLKRSYSRLRGSGPLVLHSMMLRVDHVDLALRAKAFEFIGLLLRRAVARIEACSCLSPQGCVECVCDERCKEMNVVMSKAGAGVILRCLLGWEVDVDALPWGEDFDGEEFGVGGSGELAGGLETVVRAEEVPWKVGCRAEER